jgi:glycosyltransferase involved in cell wall biosynthesis
VAVISVLVAVHNGEAFLDTCLTSLRAQTLTDIEVICVDDGSTDSTPEILRRHAAADGRIRVLAQENSGAAAARNHALRHATGVYALMVDSDDWITPDTLASASAALDKGAFDGVFLQLYRYHQETEIAVHEPLPATPLSGVEAFRLSLDGQVHGLVCWKRSFLTQYGFDEQGMYGDEYSTRLLLINSSTLGSCEGKYFYRKHAASITSKFSRRWFDALSTQARIQELIDAHTLAPEVSSDFLKTRFHTLEWLLRSLYTHRHDLSRDEFSTLKKKLADSFSVVVHHTKRPPRFFPESAAKELMTRNMILLNTFVHFQEIRKRFTKSKSAKN